MRNSSSMLCLTAIACLLTLTSGPRLYADTMAYAVNSTPSGNTYDSYFGLLDLNTGAFSQIGSPINGVFVADLALAPNGTLYTLYTPISTGADEFGTINTSTGVVTPIATETGGAAGLTSIAFNANGTLYGTTYDPTQEALYSINPATGAATFDANLQGPLATATNDIGFLGDTLYTTTYASPSELYMIDIATGAGTLIGNTGIAQNNGLTGAVGGELVDTSFAGTGQVFFINPTTGAATAGVTTDRPYNFAVIATPEPATLLMMGIGLVAAFALRRGHLQSC